MLETSQEVPAATGSTQASSDAQNGSLVWKVHEELFRSRRSVGDPETVLAGSSGNPGQLRNGKGARSRFLRAGICRGLLR